MLPYSFEVVVNLMPQAGLIGRYLTWPRIKLIVLYILMYVVPKKVR